MTPEGWSSTRLGKLARHVGRGTSPTYASCSSTFYAVNQKCVRQGRVGTEHVRPHDPKAAVKPDSILRPGDICVNSTGTGTIGRVGLWETTDDATFFADTHVTIVRPDPRLVVPKFLSECLLSPWIQREMEVGCFSGSTNQVELNKSAFTELVVQLPPVPEQRKIAAILSSVDDAIDSSQAVIDQIQVVKKAMMAELLTRGLPGRHTKFKMTDIGEVPEAWEVEPLETCLSGLIDYRGKSPPKHGDGVPLITAKNVRSGYIDEEPREYIVASEFQAWMTRGIPEAGDVLFTTEAPLGNAAPIPNRKIALGQRLIALCPDRGRVDPTFFLWALLGPPFQALLFSKATGSTVQGIKQSVLRKLPVAMPSLEEQVVIGRSIQGADDRVRVERQHLGGLRSLKTSLMSVLLTGEVRVKPDNEEPHPVKDSPSFSAEASH